MSRKLIVLMVFALVLAFSCSAFAEVQNVKVGGDTSIWAFDRSTFNFANVKDGTDKKVQGNGLAQIVNLKIAADLTDAVSANLVFRNERIWGATTRNGGSGSAGDLDVYMAAGYVTLKEMFGQPFTLKAGSFGLKLGSGLLVGDADTNRVTSGPFNYELADLSPRKAFTGFVGIMDLKPIVITGAALKVTEGTVTVNNDDVNAYAINVGYDLNEIDLNGIGEAYWVERRAHRTPVDNFGVRIQASPIENFNAGAEFCYQRSKIAITTATNCQDEATRAKGDSNTAILLNAGMTMPDVVLAPSISVDFARLSKNWHPMMEDMTPADIANVIFPNTNVQCWGATLAAKPMTDVAASLRFATFRSVKQINAFSNNWNAAYDIDGNQRHLGDELDLHLTYDYTEDVQFGLMGGIFSPGKAFGPASRKDATQVIGSMKVTF
ncbi:MAG TPA: alginate export family protein [Candidatus Omnitrophota bacterium]|nr:alginate export family protein [Candidatus Omnitrophota bacterium]